MQHDLNHDRIAVVDFGGQYAHLIATKVRRSKVLAEIRQPEDSTDIFRQYKGIILSGSPALSSFGEDSTYNKEIYDLDIPILGFCFGHQEIAKHYGGAVVNGKQEWGHADLHINHDHPLFNGLGKVEQVWMSHFDSVTAVGPDFEELGHTILGAGSPPHRFAAIGSDKLRRYGFQFHPEVDDTLHGDEMIANFVRNICGCRPTWTMDSYVTEQVAKIRDQVGDRSVFLLASGGVDSTVAARLFSEALGPDRLNLLHVDNGLMRKDESAGVVEMFKDMGLDRNFTPRTPFWRPWQARSNPRTSAAPSATPSSPYSRAKPRGWISRTICSGRAPSIPTPSRPAAPSAPTPSRLTTIGYRSSRR